MSSRKLFVPKWFLDQYPEYRSNPHFVEISPIITDAPREHVESPECWCMPTLYYVDKDTGQRCYSHKSDEELNQ